MEAFKALATGGQSTIDDFAKNVYIKNNLTNKLEQTIRAIQSEFLRLSDASDCETLQQFENRELIVTDITIRCIVDFLILIESILLHGLKEKLTFSKVGLKVLSPVRFSYNQSTRSSTQSNIKSTNHSPDFWPVILILNHNQVNLSLKSLNNIITDVGRCRAWIRLALNDGLLSSYLRALTNDTSLLHGFYRPSAYLRDKEHMDRFLKLIDSLENIRFNLNYDYKTLNNWNKESLVLSGFSTFEDEQDDNALEPVLPAMDALKLLKDDDENFNDRRSNDFNNTSKRSLDLNLSSSRANCTTESNNATIQCLKTGWSTSPPEAKEILDNFKDDDSDVSSVISSTTASTVINHHLNKNEISKLQVVSIGSKSSPINKSLSTKSTSKSIKIKSKPHADLECSYDSLLQSYSDEANLCSTPEIRDIYMPTNDSKKVKDAIKKASQDRQTGDQMKFKQAHNFEIIPQSIVLDNSDESTQRFLSKFFKIQHEIGLDKQDYKCNKCARPIGMVYGKSRLCKYDGLHYCLDCNQDEKAIIPARVIHNWDFNKYTISKENKQKLELVENEPLINIKLTNPLLYQYNAIMKECLQLRTQLFYLHAYLFTCQESIALDLRKQVWPSEHLFEHIHLYSLNDLQQALNGNLFTNLRKSINLAKKHVVSCVLCSQKGFICEICSIPKIIYPFDVEKIFRCEMCQACFHMNCIIVQQVSSNSNSNLSTTSLNITSKKPKQKPCPRCIRLQCREKIQQIRMT